MTTIGFLIVPQFGSDMNRMREAWVEADRLGADRLYTADHFFVPRANDYKAERSREGDPEAGRPIPQEDEEPANFETATIEAAMCVTTTHAEVACLVHCYAYRNPNLFADMARTMDHLSNGRFVVGIGSGFHVKDFEEYGYDLGTHGARLRELEQALDVIKSRWRKLVPPPTREIPILMSGRGEKVSLRIVAQHADEWHCFGNLEYLEHKSAVLDQWCEKVGRDPSDIRRIAVVGDPDNPDNSPDDLVDAGFTHLVAMSYGPDWDLSELRELLSWRDARTPPDLPG